ncbi:ABC-type efflux pump, duplicated ATPase component YbhF [hydrothermal vent metagenome]|uniref:ABC-type efflux pump, duplicated ATPase component YbhF n=1 Tax=hydrothermal vent metagenome TaxID=652676 RepID=A0A3B0VY98_9ZZZZ
MNKRWSQAEIKPGQELDIPLSVRKISKQFQVGKRLIPALSAVSFQVKAGIVTGLIGPDGAGKTTLMRLACGLLVPDSGSIHVLGLDTTRQALSVQRSIGYMPQRFGLYEDLTVQENLDLYADLQNVSLKDRPGRYKELLRMTGLGPFTDRLAGRLSGGMKQKLGLACALLNPPPLLILDEPTVGVDPVSRRELWDIIYSQVRETGMSVLLSTSYMDEAERCGEVILLHEGRFLGQDTPQSFSAMLVNRTFTIQALDNGNKRELLGLLSLRPETVDAIILGDTLRLVTRTAMQPPEVERVFHIDPRQWLVKASKPRFEDSFIDKLRKEKERDETAGGGKNLRLKPAVRGGNEENTIMVKNLRRDFGSFCAVRNLSFSVRRGEIFGLLGANGAGKTTTFRMLCGLLPATSGTLRVAGQDLRQARAPARAKIGYMAQKFSLYTDLTVIQNLSFFSAAYGLHGRRQKERIQWALDSFELTELQNNYSGDLPLGYKQRLALAAALIHEPGILFLDEPTSGIDPLARREFWSYINALANAGVTAMVTTHFMEEASYCDELVIMAQGRVLAAGSPSELTSRFRSPENPEPSMEDTFIHLVEEFEQRERKAGGEPRP